MSKQQVRVLYKAILRLHRALPSELRELGDIYVKDEFRRHTKSSSSTDSHLTTFLQEWMDYYGTLVKQVGPTIANKETSGSEIGKSLSDKLDELGDHQLYQLYELKQSIDSDSSKSDKSNTKNS